VREWNRLQALGATGISCLCDRKLDCDQQSLTLKQQMPVVSISMQMPVVRTTIDMWHQAIEHNAVCSMMAVSDKSICVEMLQDGQRLDRLEELEATMFNTVYQWVHWLVARLLDPA
jgi:hypothetical protein